MIMIIVMIIIIVIIMIIMIIMIIIILIIIINLTIITITIIIMIIMIMIIMIFIIIMIIIMIIIRGGLRGGWVGLGGGRLFLRDSTPCRPKGFPLWYLLRNSFLADWPKNFCKGAFGDNVY